MKIEDYATEVNRTVGWAHKDAADASCALGLCGEAGEVADIIKKSLFHGHPLDRDALRDELGDVLWYLVALAGANDLTIQEVVDANVRKLRRRYPDGFSEERSRNRLDT